MALLQLSEPGQSAVPHQRRLAIGIDLGTTNSIVATIRHSLPECLSDEACHILLPSVVRYRSDGSVEVGMAARAAQAADPHNTLASIKRLMGRGMADVPAEVRQQYCFTESAEGAGMVRIQTVAGARTPVEVSAEILKVLRARALASLGDELVGAVITVPAYFDDAQRQATKDAAKLAGLNVLRLLNEPTAAAIAYGLDEGVEGVYAVYDLGGGTFDFSVLRLSKGVFEVLATSGDASLGGDDFDQCVASWARQELGLGHLSPTQMRTLLVESRRAKEALTKDDSVQLSLNFDDGTAHRCTLTRTRFYALTAHLVARTLLPVRRALRDAKLGVAAINGIVMVGGATRMPHVRDAVADFFEQPVLTDIDPDKVVAIGAAIQANVLAGNRRADEDWLLLDVIPLSLGLETMGGLVEKIIPRNSTIPIAKAQDFTTFKDGQTAMAIHVVQGERELVSDCRSLARFELQGIPPMAAGAARIRVSFQVDADGLLSVAAQEQSSGVHAAVSVKPSYGLSDEEITSMLQAGFAHADADMQKRNLREQQVEAQRLHEALVAALAADAQLLNAEEYRALQLAIAALEAVCQGEDAQAIKDKMAALNKASEEFAARRMNKIIRGALTGRNVDDLKV